MKLVSLYILLVPATVLVLTGIAVVLDSAISSIFNPGPHGLSEVLYAFTSGTNNNGSAFGGLNANTDLLQHLARDRDVDRSFRVDRVGPRIGGFARAQAHVPVSAGTFPTTSPLFVGLLIGVILIVTALTYFPALSLGPIVEGLS